MNTLIPNIIRGGTAIPVNGKKNLYLMKGRKHKNGGIDIGRNIEVEGGELMKLDNKSTKIFSAQPILNGKSPTQKVLEGENMNEVFNKQEMYKKRNELNDDGTKIKRSMGGLSRNKDYGSSKKPYPSVKSKDFAGGNRSYPIPTKADAIDALRLAGLHHRDDVKSKVYSKYPELKRKKAAFGYNGKSIYDRMSLPININVPDGYEGIIDNLSKRLPFNYSKLQPLETPDSSFKIKTPNFIQDRLVDSLNKKKQYHGLSNSTDEDHKDVGNTIKNYYRKNEIGDYVTAAGNTIGSIGSFLINRNMLNHQQAPQRPVQVQPVKYNTNYNINPELDALREAAGKVERNLSRNTTSSQSFRNAVLSNRNNTLSQLNTLYGDKYNKEQTLINEDLKNRQDVRTANVNKYNDWLKSTNEFRNNIADQKAENAVDLLSNANSGISNIFSNREARRKDITFLYAILAQNPNVSPKFLADILNGIYSWR